MKKNLPNDIGRFFAYNRWDVLFGACATGQLLKATGANKLFFEELYITGVAAKDAGRVILL